MSEKAINSSRPPDVTSIHGICYICDENRNLFARFLWSFAFITSLVGFLFCGYQITTSSFFNLDIATNIRQISAHEIPFPSVTLCSPLFAKDGLGNYSKFLEDLKASNNKLETNLTATECQFLSVNSQKCSQKAAKAVSGECGNLNEGESVVKLMKKSSLEVARALTGCSWSEKSIDCSRMFNSIVTDYGFCYSFNMQGFGTIFERGTISDDFKSYKR